LKADGSSGIKTFKNKLIYFGTVILFFFIFSSLINQFIASKIGVKPSTIPGYSLYVGFNEKYYGKYNTEDANKLFELSDKPGWTAQDAQREMLYEFKSRILHENIDFLKLFHFKYEQFWENDTSAIYYMRSIVPDQDEKNLLDVIGNAFYYFTILLSGAATFNLWRRRENPVTLLFPIYFIGLTMAQMLVEVSGRYHYSGFLVFTIMTAYVLFLPAKKVIVNNRS
jgi:hypothetical protein